MASNPRDEPAPALHAFFGQPNDELLLAAIGESIGLMLAEHGEAALPEVARTIALTNRAEYHVGNGGFRYFFEPQDHRTPETVAALRAIGADDTARALARAVAFFPHGEPHADWNQRIEFLDSMPAHVCTRFESEAPLLYALSAQQARYARAHAAAFAAMPSPRKARLPPRA